MCSLGEDGIIDEAKLDELLCINSYLNFLQNNTGPISDGYADITKCTRDDFVVFTKWTGAMDVVYNEKEANEAKERSGNSVEVYNGMLPAYGMLPTLQLPCLYGFTASLDTITPSDHTELSVLSVPVADILSAGVSNLGSSGGDIADIVPTAEDDKGSILAATDKVEVNILSSSE